MQQLGNQGPVLNKAQILEMQLAVGYSLPPVPIAPEKIPVTAATQMPEGEVAFLRVSPALPMTNPGKTLVLTRA
jgi:hypothetical protein